MRFIRTIGWVIGGGVALVGLFFIYLAMSGDGGIGSTDFLFGFVWVVVGLFFVFTAEIVETHLLRSGR